MCLVSGVLHMQIAKYASCAGKLLLPLDPLLLGSKSTCPCYTAPDLLPIAPNPHPSTQPPTQPFTWQDAVVERGLLSLFYCQEAREGPAGSTQMSAMQVQDSGGRWQDVQLGPNEVAVLLGHTMEHATAGLLRASVHRVVGSPYASASPPGGRRRSVGQTAGRTTLQFELRPRPAAVLDLRPQLEAAGHTISTR